MTKEKNEKVSGTEKVPVTFNGDQIKFIEKYKGVLGNTKSEIIRNIVINWLLQRGNDDKP